LVSPAVETNWGSLAVLGAESANNYTLPVAARQKERVDEAQNFTAGKVVKLPGLADLLIEGQQSDTGLKKPARSNRRARTLYYDLLKAPSSD